MSVKDKRSFLVTFRGQKEVQAYTHEDARTQVEQMKNINPEEGITTNGYSEIMADGIIHNIPQIITLMFSIFYMIGFISFFNYISSIEQSIMQNLFLCMMVLLFIVTMRLPIRAGNWFRHLNRRR